MRVEGAERYGTATVERLVGLAGLRPGADYSLTRLQDARGFEAVTGNAGNPITSLVFLDPNQLLRLGADTGIGPAGALEGSRRDLAKVRAVGVTTTGSSRESTVDLSLWIP